jgi:hypothetical protein
VAQTTAATIVSEHGSRLRLANPRQFKGSRGLVASKHSTGQRESTTETRHQRLKASENQIVTAIATITESQSLDTGPGGMDAPHVT